MKTTQPAIWICPDKYRGTMTAMEAAMVIADAIRPQAAEYDVLLAPMADGGEGTAALLGRLHGATLMREVETLNPLGAPTTAPWWQNPVSGEAFIDSASVIGHDTVKGDLQPWQSSSYGLGVAIRKILDSDPRVVLNVCVGGTVTIDGGSGLLQGLGWRFLGRPGTRFSTPILPVELDKVQMIDPPTDYQILATRIRAISDVQAPLWNNDGISSLTFASQKGVKEEDLVKLRKLLHSWEVTSMPEYVEREISGAGGGVGFALQRVVGAPASLGADEMVKAYGIFREVVDGTIVITGEGCLVEHSSAGIVGGTLMRHCQHHHFPLYILPGMVKGAQASRNRGRGHPDGNPPLRRFGGRVPRGQVIPCDKFLPDEPLSPSVAKQRLRLAALHTLHLD